MYIDKYREIITTSTHNIPQRLKRIDKDYFVVRNHDTCQFEIHHWKQPHNTFCLSIPFNELDERTLQRVRETSVEYARNIFAEIERSNNKLEADRSKKAKDITETVTKDVYRYCKKYESKDTIDKDSKYFKDVV